MVATRGIFFECGCLSTTATCPFGLRKSKQVRVQLIRAFFYLQNLQNFFLLVIFSTIFQLFSKGFFYVTIKITMRDKTLPLLLKRVVQATPDAPAQAYRDDNKEIKMISYSEMQEIIMNIAAGLLEIGCKKEDKIGLIADNRKEWFHLSMALSSIGAIDVPRGCDATEQDITYILSFTECHTVILENTKQIIKVLKNIDKMPTLKKIISIDDINFDEIKKDFSKEMGVITFFTYKEILGKGKAKGNAEVLKAIENVMPDDIATIIFTSGTTGQPKGVVLTHKNFLAQIPDLMRRIPIVAGQLALSVLPVWHSFERECEYIIISSSACIFYSKPIGSVILQDMVDANPTIMPSVPRIWEAVYDGVCKKMRKTGGITLFLFNFFLTIGIAWSRLWRCVTGKRVHYSRITQILYPILSIIPAIVLFPLHFLGNVLIFKKIRAKLGTKFLAGVSGGGALPPNVDEFFWAVGINIVEGYGITEAAPVVSVRHIPHPIFGTIGEPIDCLEAKIIGENGEELPVGKKGVLHIKGDSIMSGYYNNPEKTAEALKDGWLNTGDLALRTITGELVIRGRQKNTIVLRGGENIEPAPIEMKLQQSQFINLAVVLGQDQRYLAALIVVDGDSLLSYAKTNNMKEETVQELVKNEEIKKMYEKIVAELVSHHNGFKLYERINKICLLANEFKVGVELSAKQDIMRYKIEDIYKKEIASLFS